MKEKSIKKIEGPETKKKIGFGGSTRQNHDLGNLDQHVKPANQFTNPTEINNLFFFKIVFLNYMITKIDNHKIEYQLNTRTFLNRDNLKENKMK